MRFLVSSLALVNVLFFCWAHWIDRPSVVRASASSVPVLRLAPPLSAQAAAKAKAPPRCESFGPLTNRETVGAVGTALRARSFNPHERSARGEVPDGYWVYIDKLNDSQARARALKRLARAGVRDAAALPTNGQVSVGLFSEKSGAELRAGAVRAAGLDPIIKPRLQPVDEYWYDVEAPGDMPLPTAVTLMAGLSADTSPEWNACPGGETAEAATP